jgi:hypothetical protein
VDLRVTLTLNLVAKVNIDLSFFLDLFIFIIQAIVFLCVYVIKFNDGKCQIKIKC